MNLTGINGNKRLCDPAIGGGTPGAILVSYPFAGVIVVYDEAGGSAIGSLAVPGCDLLHAYYDQ